MVDPHSSSVTANHCFIHLSTAVEASANDTLVQTTGTLFAPDLRGTTDETVQAVSPGRFRRELTAQATEPVTDAITQGALEEEQFRFS
jgi:hypothetical protein